MTSKRILVVDDEKAILSLLKISIEFMGPEYQVVAVSNGLMALAELHGDDLAELVSAGKLRYIYWGGESGPPGG